LDGAAFFAHLYCLIAGQTRAKDRHFADAMTPKFLNPFNKKSMQLLFA
jgi:hypothetical protein